MFGMEAHRRQQKKKKTTTTTRKSGSEISKKKRRIRNQSHTLFPLLLAALHNNDKALVKQCLNRLYSSLPHTLSAPLLSLLPVLLNSKCGEIECRSLELIGAASLMSLEMNEVIALDGGIMKGVISLLGSSRRRTSVAACNAVLDLATTSVGKNQLIEFAAVQNLILFFIQVPRSSVGILDLSSDSVLFEEDELPVLSLQAAVVLINSCTIEQLQRIPTKLSEALLFNLKLLWEGMRGNRLHCLSQKWCGGQRLYKSNIKPSNIAECVFRLSINHRQCQGPIDFDQVKRGIFTSRGVSIEQFMSDYWELSPLFMRNASEASTRDNIFGPFVQYLGSKEAVPSFIPSILKSMVSCPPIASDELDIIRFISEVKNNFGCPIIYDQDIRILKTQCGRELHFFEEHSGTLFSQDSHVLNVDDILKCKEAIEEGYSIALRGMEFRFQSVAAIADGLAHLFGQPSTGVNMYLTPPNSQGLARHSDDHCVFVCQLFGVKRWKIFPRSSLQLPRLYEPRSSLHGLEVENQVFDGCKQFLLEEGDILYIPRGFPHEAQTVVDEGVCCGRAGLSLHLTLAVEIEPPFEWEGFIHIALYYWNEKLSQPQSMSDDSVSWKLQVACVNLLHVAIKLIGDQDQAFQRACLVGAIPFSTVSEGCPPVRQKEIFRYLISRVNNNSKFSDAIRYVEAAVQKQEDPLEQVRWLQNLAAEEGIVESHSRNASMADGCELFILLCQHREIAEAAFLQVKSNFCCGVMFEDVEQKYILLLEKYRKVRTQYSKGMLSMHCGNWST